MGWSYAPNLASTPGEQGQSDLCYLLILNTVILTLVAGYYGVPGAHQRQLAGSLRPKILLSSGSRPLPEPLEQKDTNGRKRRSDSEAGDSSPSNPSYPLKKLS